ncbi:MAG: hypothetical protein GXP48_08670 [Acidobacteria bacterium]|nr:hypothetical protein [Acidobacteriota bacterium]
MPQHLCARLVELAEDPDTARIDTAVFELFTFSPEESRIVTTLAERVQIVPGRERVTA